MTYQFTLADIKVLKEMHVSVEDGASVLEHYRQHSREQRRTIDRLITEKQQLAETARRMAVEHHRELWNWQFAAYALGALCVFLIGWLS
jgi:DNA-binding transcriptional MerR regulator